MKRLFLTIGLMGVFAYCNAQFFIGGNLGVGFSNSGKTTETYTLSNTTIKKEVDPDKYFNFYIAPKIGYTINDRMDIGLSIKFGMDQVKTFAIISSDPQSYKLTKSTDLGLGMFFHYSMIEAGNLSFFLEANTAFNISNSKWESEQSISNTKTTVSGDGSKTKLFEIGITPGLKYSLNDNLILEFMADVLSIGFTYSKIEYETDNYKIDDDVIYSHYKSEKSSNNFGLRANNGTFRVGAIYKF